MGPVYWREKEGHLDWNTSLSLDGLVSSMDLPT